jgi:hypothetical protein
MAATAKKADSTSSSAVEYSPDERYMRVRRLLTVFTLHLPAIHPSTV